MIFRRVAVDSEKTRKTLSPAFLASLGVHLVVAVALMRMLILNADFSQAPRKQVTPQERVGFVQLGRAGEKPTAGKVGGDGRPFTPREIHVVAPRIVPSAIPMPNVTA